MKLKHQIRFRTPMLVPWIGLVPILVVGDTFEDLVAAFSGSYQSKKGLFVCELKGANLIFFYQ